MPESYQFVSSKYNTSQNATRILRCCFAELMKSYIKISLAILILTMVVSLQVLAQDPSSQMKSSCIIDAVPTEVPISNGFIGHGGCCSN